MSEFTILEQARTFIQENPNLYILFFIIILSLVFFSVIKGAYSDLLTVIILSLIVPSALFLIVKFSYTSYSWMIKYLILVLAILFLISLFHLMQNSDRYSRYLEHSRRSEKRIKKRKRKIKRKI